MATAPTFVTQDPLQDIADTVAFYESQTGLALAPAAVERLILNAIAYRLSLIKAQVQDAALQNLVDFAIAPSLDYLGIYVGVTRLAAAPAIAQIEFTLNVNVSGITVPQGTRIASIDGLAVFVLTADVFIAATILTGTGTAECDTNGQAANGYAPGQVTQIQDPFPYIISATNTATTAGGADAEGDPSLRTRIKLAPSAFSVAGSRNAYRYHALTASELLVDCAVPETLGDGVVNLYPLMRDGSATPSLILTAVEDACTGEQVRPISDTVNAIAPTRTTFSIALVVTPYVGYSTVTMEAAIEEALTDWVESKRQTLGNDIVDTQIFAVAHNAVPGQAYDMSLTAWSDITIAPTAFAFLTSVSVTFNTAVVG